MESFSRGIGSIGVLLGVVAAMFGSLGILASTENEFHPGGLAVGLLLWAIAAALLAFRHRFDDELLVASSKRVLVARQLKSGKWRFVQLAAADIKQVVVAGAMSTWEWTQSRAMVLSIRASTKTVEFGGGLTVEDLEELRGLLVERLKLEEPDSSNSFTGQASWPGSWTPQHLCRTTTPQPSPGGKRAKLRSVHSGPMY